MVEKRLEMLRKRSPKDFNASTFGAKETKINVFGEDIRVSHCVGESTIFFSAVVFSENNFIPKSVREFVESGEHILRERIQVFLKIDESRCQVFLSCRENFCDSKKTDFKNVLEEFALLAGEYRIFLGESGQKDLLPVFNK